MLYYFAVPLAHLCEGSYMYDYGLNSGSLVSLILSNQLNYSFSAVRTINVNPGVVGGAGGD